MRNSRAMCGTLEKFAHSDFNLPMTAIAGIKQNACPFSFRRPCFSLVRRGLFAPPQTGFSVCPAPSGCTTKPAGPRHFTATAGAVGYACVVHHTPFCAKLQEFLSQFASVFSPGEILPRSFSSFRTAENTSTSEAGGCHYAGKALCSSRTRQTCNTILSVA